MITILGELIEGQRYVILNLERGDSAKPVWWKSDGHGYTDAPFDAGIYTKETIEDQTLGSDDIVIPLTWKGLEAIGFLCSYDPNLLMKNMKKAL